MAEYNFNDMEQAKRRVMEMQRRSRNYTDGRGAEPPPSSRKASPPPPEPTPEPKPEPEPEHEQAEKRPVPAQDPLAGLLNLGGLGGDRTLILLLLVLLWGEKADRWLMLALLYCAL